MPRDDHVRVTVDLSQGTYDRFKDKIHRLNQARPDDAATITNTSVLRGMVGSWIQGRVPGPEDIEV